MSELEQISISAFWQELDPKAMFMQQHIGELDIGDGRKWEVTGSLNGLDLIVKTDIPTPGSDGKDASGGMRRFVLRGVGTIKALATELLTPENDVDNKTEDRELHGEG